MEPLGVDIYTPDFIKIAEGFGWNSLRAVDHQDLHARLLEARDSALPTLIEVREAAPFVSAS
ncbi:hypothetical protein D3C84_1173930 [compost metagenome]